MNIGKIASQAGHAYLNAYLQTLDKNAEKAYAYLNSPTKVCLGANEKEFFKLSYLLDKNNIDYVKVVDPDFTILDNRVIRNDGNFEPACTGIGIGPISKVECPNVIKKLKLME